MSLQKTIQPSSVIQGGIARGISQFHELLKIAVSKLDDHKVIDAVSFFSDGGRAAEELREDVFGTNESMSEMFMQLAVVCFIVSIVYRRK